MSAACARRLSVWSKLTELAFDIVEASDFLGEDTLKSTGVAVEISELHQAELAQGVDNLSADLI